MKYKVDNLGEHLKTLRKEQQLTLKVVSEYTGLSIGYISRIENGSSSPSLETLYKLSTILSFNIEDVCEFQPIRDEEEGVPIEDVFQTIKISIDGAVLTDKDKYKMVSLLKEIYQMNWDDEVNKITNISTILSLVDNLKKG